jgi:hypothetical protein
MFSLLAFGLGLYTVYGVLTSSLGGEGLSFELDVDQATGKGILQVQVNPSNPSYIDATLSLELSILNSMGTPVASDLKSANLSPGSTEPFNIILEVSPEDLEELARGEGSSLEIRIELRTLYNLIGISDTITIPQGGLK